MLYLWLPMRGAYGIGCLTKIIRAFYVVPVLLVSATLAQPVRPALAAGMIPVGAGPVSIATAAGRTYVSNYTDNTVSVIDNKVGAVVATVAVGSGPTALAVDPDTNRIYVANSSDQTVSVIDGASDQVIGSPIHVYVDIEAGLTVDPSTNRIYVGDSDGNTITVIDGSTDTVFPGSLGFITVGNDVQGITVDPVSHRLYVANYGDGTVSVVDSLTGGIVSTVSVGSQPFASILDAPQHRLYVANSGDNTISVLNTTTDTSIGAPLAVGNSLTGITLNTTLHHIYVANQADNTISVIGEDTNTVLGTIPTGTSPGGIAVDGSTNDIYDTLQDTNQVQVLADPFGSPGPGPMPTSELGSGEIMLVGVIPLLALVLYQRRVRQHKQAS